MVSSMAGGVGQRASRCTSRITLPLSVTTPSRHTGLPAELHELARDVGARHGDHLDRQREGAERVDQLAVVDDADELALRRRR